MKILFITDLYPIKNDEKTTPRTLSDFVENWRKLGHEVEVIKPNFILNSFIRRKPFYKTENYDGVLNINYWTPFWFNVEKKLKSAPTADIVIAHMPSGILFADKLGLPFVAGIHNSDLTILTNPLYKFHFKKRMEIALTNAKAIACRSFVLREKFLKLYPQFEGKTFIAPSGVDESLITDRSTLQPFNHSPITILTCANYKKRKNIEKVLTATEDLEGFEVTVIGEGTDIAKLRKLNPKATFKAYQPKEKVLAEMRNSDIFILPSEGETFGMVYLEAMASGCITICSENDGIDGIIKNGENGFTISPNSDKIRALLINIKNTDKETLKLLQDNSFETIKRYSANSCAGNYLQQIFKIM